jgi:serine/threonine protein kinase
VLVSESSDIRLIDFSIAQQSSWGRMFKFGKTKWGGTPAYMAPEQIRGDGVTPATDQYAFGILAYELFTRRAPFVAPTQNALLEKHLLEQPPPIRKFLPKVPQDVDRVILRMLEKDSANRWPDMAAVDYELGKLSEKWGVWWVDPLGATSRTAAHTARLAMPTTPPSAAASAMVSREAAGPTKAVAKPAPPAGAARPTTRRASSPKVQAVAAGAAAKPPEPARRPSDPKIAAVAADAAAKPQEPSNEPARPASNPKIPAVAAEPAPAAGPAAPAEAPASGPVALGSVTPADSDNIDRLLKERLDRRLEEERHRMQKPAEGGEPSKPLPRTAPHESDLNLPAVR